MSFVIAVIGAYYVDRVGRRPLLLYVKAGSSLQPELVELWGVLPKRKNLCRLNVSQRSYRLSGQRNAKLKTCIDTPICHAALFGLPSPLQLGNITRHNQRLLPELLLHLSLCSAPSMLLASIVSAAFTCSRTC